MKFELTRVTALSWGVLYFAGHLYMLIGAARHNMHFITGLCVVFCGIEIVSILCTLRAWHLFDDD